MAKKTNQTKTTTTRRTVITNGSIVRTCAFWGMAVAAVLYLVSGIIALIDRFAGTSLSQIVGIFSLLGNIAMIVAIAFPAYSYVSGKSKNWRIIYWILLAVFVLGVVFGAIPTIA